MSFTTEIKDLEFSFNKDGLIPAIAQDWLDGSVLMMAWMNQASIEKTLTTGEAHYWSRSRKKLWHKGEESGHFQLIKNIRYDCDSDTILLSVKQVGESACHTGARSCFFKNIQSRSINSALLEEPPSDKCSELFRIIEDRKINPHPKSYTNNLFDAGDNKILKKIGEESAEFIMACKDNDAESIANEAADLLFHLQVALSKHNVNWKNVLEVLALRRKA